MVTSIDERNAMVKVSWLEIRERVAQVEPRFAELVDEISPDKSYPLFLAYYPYGAIKGDVISTFFPDNNGGYFRIGDADAPKEITTHLGYSKGCAPFALLLEKNLELFVDLKSENITIPRILYTPGSFFPFSRILSRKSRRRYTPNGVLTMTSGARSVFMLPNIGCHVNHANLQRDFNVRNPPAKNLYDHWQIFKEIISSGSVQCDWKSCLLYFSQKWLDSIENDKAWMKLKLYLHELVWQQYEFDRSNFYYDISFSLIQKKRNLKPNPYLADTARHLINVALGIAPGYIPVCDNHSLPREQLENAFIGSYGLKKYFPIIIQPSHYHFESANYPIYYSLQHPSTHLFSPKSTTAASTLAEMRELERIIRIFTSELANDNSMCADTIMNSISKNITFNYYHNKVDQHHIIKSSSEIVEHDNRFSGSRYTTSSEHAKFACDAPFLRGCISINTT